MAAITFQISISKKDAIQMVLKDWAKVYNNPEFIKSDPIQFPKKYMGKRAASLRLGFLSGIVRLSLRRQIGWIKIFAKTLIVG